MSQDREGQQKPRKLYLRNISADVQEDDIKEFFNEFPSAQVSIKSKQGGIHFAFVQFDSHADAQRALEDKLNKNLRGNEVHIEFARGGRGPRGGGRGGLMRGTSQCFNCHKIGHFARECQERRRQDRYDRYDRDDRYGGRGDRYDRGGDRHRQRERSRSSHSSRDRRRRSRSSSHGKGRRDRHQDRRESY